MENPLNPPENQIPLDKQNPLEDPLLDALEQNIENPPGFVDPLVGNDGQFMDELASQLDQVEANIENTPPLLPGSTIINDGNELNAQDDELETASLSEEPESFETINELEETIQNPLSSDSQDSDAHTFKQPVSKPKRRGGGSRLRRRPRFFKRPAVKQTGSLISRRNNRPRICPEDRKHIDEQKCESCEKYRHWPKGTNEEPKKCWYDWRMERNKDGHDTDEES